MFEKKIILIIQMGLGLFLALAIMDGMAFAQESPPAKPPEENKIKITSNRLESDSQSKTAEFIGNVVARQAETVIQADRLKIFYQGDVGSSGGLASSSNSITKIIARGNVQMKMDDREAIADTATYVIKTKVLTLEGANARVSQGDNFISGTKIIFYRADERTIVEGSQQNQVKAIFFPKDKGLQ
jgi:lipopolysaccharide export system protein LptA